MRRRHFTQYLNFFIWIIAFGVGVIFLANYLIPRPTVFQSSAFNPDGANYYVDKDGIGGKPCNDSYPGTIDQPFCSISRGLSAFQPGDNLYVRAGSYPAFTFSRSGSAGFYFNLAAYNQEKVVIQGGSEAIKLSGASYIRISGFEVTGATGNYGAGIRVTNNGGSLASNNLIENNLVHDNLGANTTGILIEDGSHNRVVNNRVYNNYLSGIEVLSHPKVTPDGVTGNEVTDNVVYNQTQGGGNSDGIKLEGPGTKNTLVAHNTVYGNADDGIDTWNSSHNTVVGNLSYNHNGSGDGNGFKLGGGGTGGYNLVKQNIAYGNKRNGFDTNGTGNNEFYHNVAYNNANFGFEDGWKDAPCTSSSCPDIYINNIGYNNVRGNFSASDYVKIAHNNLWYSDTGSPKVFYNYTAYSSLANFYTASGNRLDNPSAGNLSSLSANPFFANVVGGDFHLTSTSPAIDHGDPNNPGNISATLVPDLGAFEFSASLTTSPLPSPSLTPTPSPSSPPSSDTTPPSVSITNPASGTVIPKGNSVDISASANDNTGIAKLEIFVNNTLLCTTNSSNYTCTWKTPKGKSKTHTVSAVATDHVGNSGSTSIQVTVQ